MKLYNFDEFINESTSEKYEIYRKTDGVIKELITGSLNTLSLRFSKAIESAAKRYPKQVKEDPETIEELINALNVAAEIKFRDNKTVYELK